MRITPLLIANALLTTPLIGQVVVQQPRASLVSWDRMQEACGEGEYDACTRFIDYSLSATCVTRGDGISTAATATFKPWILLHDIRRLDHEKQHIEDVRRFAEDYINELEQNRFESAAQCQSEAELLMRTFGKTMQGFALRSNLQRHPVLRRRAGR